MKKIKKQTKYTVLSHPYVFIVVGVDTNDDGDYYWPRVYGPFTERQYAENCAAKLGEDSKAILKLPIKGSKPKVMCETILMTQDMLIMDMAK